MMRAKIVIYEKDSSPLRPAIESLCDIFEHDAARLNKADVMNLLASFVAYGIGAISGGDYEQAQKYAKEFSSALPEVLEHIHRKSS